MSKRGRPPALTPELAMMIGCAISAKVPMSVIVATTSVSSSTIMRYVRRGQSGDVRCQELMRVWLEHRKFDESLASQYSLHSDPELDAF